MRDKPKEVVITGIIGIVLLLIGVFALFKEVKFQSQKDSKKYVKIEGTLIDFEHTRTRTGRKGRTRIKNSYTPIYSYDDNGIKRTYKSQNSSSIKSGQIGDTVVLYKNVKNGKVREGSFRYYSLLMKFAFGGMFIYISINTYKKRTA